MRRIIWRSSCFLFRIFINLRTKRSISHISKDSLTKPFFDALNEYLNNNYSKEEKLWLNKIEIMNRELQYSKTILSIVDHGAGSPHLQTENKKISNAKTIKKTVGEIYRSMMEPYIWPLFLFTLIRQFKPSTCLELGTCLGVSASFQAAALKLNGIGRMITLEGADELASYAINHFEQLKLDNVKVISGRFQDTLDGVLQSNQPIDYVYIDGHHDEIATIKYFTQILPFLNEHSIIILDDISWSKGMNRAWEIIKRNEKVKVSIDLKRIGVCLINGDNNRSECIKIPML